LAPVGSTADQRLLSDNKTIDTPVGKFGFWKITRIDPSYTSSDYWILFGRLGKWHVKNSHYGRRTPLLAILVVASMAGALALAAKHRRPAEIESDPGDQGCK
jgi:hypothetical protein